MTPQGSAQEGDSLWCVVLNADNPHDFQVWGPYTSEEADRVFERLAERPTAWGAKRLVQAPMSKDWDAENAD